MSGGCPSCGGFDPLDGRTPVCQCGTAWARGPARRAGLTRRTGLAPGKGFGVRKPMAAGRGLSRSSTPTGAGAARQAPAPRPRRPRVAGPVREVVRARSGERCEVAATAECRARGRRLDAPGIGGSQHHRLPGRMGGSKRAEVHGAANLLQVCGHGTAGCHGAIESGRTAALAAGWLLREGQDPAGVPVLLHDGRRVLLGESYRVARADDVPA